MAKVKITTGSNLAYNNYTGNETPDAPQESEVTKQHRAEIEKQRKELLSPVYKDKKGKEQIRPTEQIAGRRYILDNLAKANAGTDDGDEHIKSLLKSPDANIAKAAKMYLEDADNDTRNSIRNIRKLQTGLHLSKPVQAPEQQPQVDPNARYTAAGRAALQQKKTQPQPVAGTKPQSKITNTGTIQKAQLPDKNVAQSAKPEVDIFGAAVPQKATPVQLSPAVNKPVEKLNIAAVPAHAQATKSDVLKSLRQDPLSKNFDPTKATVAAITGANQLSEGEVDAEIADLTKFDGPLTPLQYQKLRNLKTEQARYVFENAINQKPVHVKDGKVRIATDPMANLDLAEQAWLASARALLKARGESPEETKEILELFFDENGHIDSNISQLEGKYGSYDPELLKSYRQLQEARHNFKNLAYIKERKGEEFDLEDLKEWNLGDFMAGSLRNATALGSAAMTVATGRRAGIGAFGNDDVANLELLKQMTSAPTNEGYNKALEAMSEGTFWRDMAYTGSTLAASLYSPGGSLGAGARLATGAGMAYRAARATKYGQNVLKNWEKVTPLIAKMEKPIEKLTQTDVGRKLFNMGKTFMQGADEEIARQMITFATAAVIDNAHDITEEKILEGAETGAAFGMFGHVFGKMGGALMQRTARVKAALTDATPEAKLYVEKMHKLAYAAGQVPAGVVQTPVVEAMQTGDWSKIFDIDKQDAQDLIMGVLFFGKDYKQIARPNLMGRAGSLGEARDDMYRSAENRTNREINTIQDYIDAVKNEDRQEEAFKATENEQPVVEPVTEQKVQPQPKAMRQAAEEIAVQMGEAARDETPVRGPRKADAPKTIAHHVRQVVGDNKTVGGVIDGIIGTVEDATDLKLLTHMKRLVGDMPIEFKSNMKSSAQYDAGRKVVGFSTRARVENMAGPEAVKVAIMEEAAHAITVDRLATDDEFRTEMEEIYKKADENKILYQGDSETAKYHLSSLEEFTAGTINPRTGIRELLKRIPNEKGEATDKVGKPSMWDRVRNLFSRKQFAAAEETPAAENYFDMFMDTLDRHILKPEAVVDKPIEEMTIPELEKAMLRAEPDSQEYIMYQAAHEIRMEDEAMSETFGTHQDIFKKLGATGDDRDAARAAKRLSALGWKFDVNDELLLLKGMEWYQNEYGSADLEGMSPAQKGNVLADYLEYEMQDPLAFKSQLEEIKKIMTLEGDVLGTDRAHDSEDITEREIEFLHQNLAEVFGFSTSRNFTERQRDLILNDPDKYFAEYRQKAAEQANVVAAHNPELAKRLIEKYDELARRSYYIMHNSEDITPVKGSREYDPASKSYRYTFDKFAPGEETNSNKKRLRWNGVKRTALREGMRSLGIIADTPGATDFVKDVVANVQSAKLHEVQGFHDNGDNLNNMPEGLDEDIEKIAHAFINKNMYLLPRKISGGTVVFDTTHIFPESYHKAPLRDKLQYQSELQEQMFWHALSSEANGVAGLKLTDFREYLDHTKLWNHVVKNKGILDSDSIKKVLKEGVDPKSLLEALPKNQNRMEALRKKFAAFYTLPDGSTFKPLKQEYNELLKNQQEKGVSAEQTQFQRSNFLKAKEVQNLTSLFNWMSDPAGKSRFTEPVKDDGFTKVFKSSKLTEKYLGVIAGDYKAIRSVEDMVRILPQKYADMIAADNGQYNLFESELTHKHGIHFKDGKPHIKTAVIKLDPTIEDPLRMALNKYAVDGASFFVNRGFHEFAADLLGKEEAGSIKPAWYNAEDGTTQIWKTAAHLPDMDKYTEQFNPVFYQFMKNLEAQGITMVTFDSSIKSNGNFKNRRLVRDDGSRYVLNHQNQLVDVEVLKDGGWASDGERLKSAIEQEQMAVTQGLVPDYVISEVPLVGDNGLRFVSASSAQKTRSPGLGVIDLPANTSMHPYGKTVGKNLRVVAERIAGEAVRAFQGHNTLRQIMADTSKKWSDGELERAGLFLKEVQKRIENLEESPDKFMSIGAQAEISRYIAAAVDEDGRAIPERLKALTIFPNLFVRGKFAKSTEAIYADRVAQQMLERASRVKTRGATVKIMPAVDPRASMHRFLDYLAEKGEDAQTNLLKAAELEQYHLDENGLLRGYKEDGQGIVLSRDRIEQLNEELRRDGKPELTIGSRLFLKLTPDDDPSSLSPQILIGMSEVPNTIQVNESFQGEILGRDKDGDDLGIIVDSKYWDSADGQSYFDDTWVSMTEMGVHKGRFKHDELGTTNMQDEINSKLGAFSSAGEPQVNKGVLLADGSPVRSRPMIQHADDPRYYRRALEAAASIGGKVTNLRKLTQAIQNSEKSFVPDEQGGYRLQIKNSKIALELNYNPKLIDKNINTWKQLGVVDGYVAHPIDADDLYYGTFIRSINGEPWGRASDAARKDAMAALDKWADHVSEFTVNKFSDKNPTMYDKQAKKTRGVEHNDFVDLANTAKGDGTSQASIFVRNLKNLDLKKTENPEAVREKILNETLPKIATTVKAMAQRAGLPKLDMPTRVITDRMKVVLHNTFSDKDDQFIHTTLTKNNYEATFKKPEGEGKIDRTIMNTMLHTMMASTPHRSLGTHIEVAANDVARAHVETQNKQNYLIITDHATGNEILKERLDLMVNADGTFNHLGVLKENGFGEEILYNERIIGKNEDKRPGFERPRINGAFYNRGSYDYMQKGRLMGRIVGNLARQAKSADPNVIAGALMTEPLKTDRIDGSMFLPKYIKPEFAGGKSVTMPYDPMDVLAGIREAGLEPLMPNGKRIESEILDVAEAAEFDRITPDTQAGSKVYGMALNAFTKKTGTVSSFDEVLKAKNHKGRYRALTKLAGKNLAEITVDDYQKVYDEILEPSLKQLDLNTEEMSMILASFHPSRVAELESMARRDGNGVSESAVRTEKAHMFIQLTDTVNDIVKNKAFQKKWGISTPADYFRRLRTEFAVFDSIVPTAIIDRTGSDAVVTDFKTELHPIFTIVNGEPGSPKFKTLNQTIGNDWLRTMSKRINKHNLESVLPFKYLKGQKDSGVKFMRDRTEQIRNEFVVKGGVTSEHIGSIIRDFEGLEEHLPEHKFTTLYDGENNPSAVLDGTAGSEFIHLQKWVAENYAGMEQLHRPLTMLYAVAQNAAAMSNYYQTLAAHMQHRLETKPVSESRIGYMKQEIDKLQSEAAKLRSLDIVTIAKEMRGLPNVNAAEFLNKESILKLTDRQKYAIGEKLFGQEYGWNESYEDLANDRLTFFERKRIVETKLKQAATYYSKKLVEVNTVNDVADREKGGAVTPELIAPITHEDVLHAMSQTTEKPVEFTHSIDNYYNRHSQNLDYAMNSLSDLFTDGYLTKPDSNPVAHRQILDQLTVNPYLSNEKHNVAEWRSKAWDQKIYTPVEIGTYGNVMTRNGANERMPIQGHILGVFKRKTVVENPALLQFVPDGESYTADKPTMVVYEAGKLHLIDMDNVEGVTTAAPVGWTRKRGYSETKKHFQDLKIDGRNILEYLADNTSRKVTPKFTEDENASFTAQTRFNNKARTKALESLAEAELPGTLQKTLEYITGRSVSLTGRMMYLGGKQALSGAMWLGASAFSFMTGNTGFASYAAARGAGKLISLAAKTGKAILGNEIAPARVAWQMSGDIPRSIAEAFAGGLRTGEASDTEAISAQQTAGLMARNKELPVASLVGSAPENSSMGIRATNKDLNMKIKMINKLTPEIKDAIAKQTTAEVGGIIDGLRKKLMDDYGLVPHLIDGQVILTDKEGKGLKDFEAEKAALISLMDHWLTWGGALQRTEIAGANAALNNGARHYERMMGYTIGFTNPDTEFLKDTMQHYLHMALGNFERHAGAKTPTGRLVTMFSHFNHEWFLNNTTHWKERHDMYNALVDAVGDDAKVQNVIKEINEVSASLGLKEKFDLNDMKRKKLLPRESTIQVGDVQMPKPMREMVRGGGKGALSALIANSIAFYAFGLLGGIFEEGSDTAYKIAQKIAPDVEGIDRATGTDHFLGRLAGTLTAVILSSFIEEDEQLKDSQIEKKRKVSYHAANNVSRSMGMGVGQRAPVEVMSFGLLGMKIMLGNDDESSNFDMKIFKQDFRRMLGTLLASTPMTGAVSAPIESGLEIYQEHDEQTKED